MIKDSIPENSGEQKILVVHRTGISVLLNQKLNSLKTQKFLLFSLCINFISDRISLLRCNVLKQEQDFLCYCYR